MKEKMAEYIRRYAQARGITPEEAEGHIMVKLYREWLATVDTIEPGVNHEKHN